MPSQPQSHWPELYTYHLPPALIAHTPAEPRDSARLLVWPVPNDEDYTFNYIANFLQAGDVLVVNRSKVIPARLHGVRPARSTGGAGGTGVPIELLLHRTLNADGHDWEVLAKPTKRLKTDDTIQLPHGGQAQVLAISPHVHVRLVPPSGQTVADYLEQAGETPLPPYIHTADTPTIRARYQTVYADATQPGSVAAPTAGLHFTPAVLAALVAKGVQVLPVVLHVGAGTFQNPTPEQLASGQLHAEWAHVPPATAAAVLAAKARGNKVIAVGTTAMRTLETWGQRGLPPQGFTGDTTLLIQPGFAFKVVDKLITNFHLPGSSLLMLVAAFIGLPELHQLYDKAIAQKYRFYSFGDSSLLTRKA
jgi:S-adenosylmethionine:tRNA ribosyltransferase-isomerase